MSILIKILREEFMVGGANLGPQVLFIKVGRGAFFQYIKRIETKMLLKGS